MDSDRNDDVLAILVTYNSEVEELERRLPGITASCRVLICDNSTDQDIRLRIERLAEAAGALYVPMNGNEGIGAAQNTGIRHALHHGLDYVLLLDDDSDVLPETVPALKAAIARLTAQGINVGAVSGRPESGAGEDLGNAPRHPSGISPCSRMNSSGTLIPAAALQTVGLMDETLFIDLVDFDWGWRALAQGFQLFIVEKVIFRHTLGEGVRSILGLRIRMPSPIRHYYQTRNGLLLAGCGHVPFAWKVRQILALTVKFLVFPLFFPPRLERLRNLMRGLLDGLSGRRGPKASRRN